MSIEEAIATAKAAGYVVLPQATTWKQTTESRHWNEETRTVEITVTHWRWVGDWNVA